MLERPCPPYRQLVIDLDATILSSTADFDSLTTQHRAGFELWSNTRRIMKTNPDLFAIRSSSSSSPHTEEMATSKPFSDGSDVSLSFILNLPGSTEPMMVCLRPHLMNFLKRARVVFDRLIIYTHGSGPYANAIRDKIDPDHKLINLVYSADDEPYRTHPETKNWILKDLRRLYPYTRTPNVNVDGVSASVNPQWSDLQWRNILKDTLIIDDRPEVWIQSHHVIPIFQFHPYKFQSSSDNYVFDYPWNRLHLQKMFIKKHVKFDHEIAIIHQRRQERLHSHLHLQQKLEEKKLPSWTGRGGEEKEKVEQNYGKDNVLNSVWLVLEGLLQIQKIYYDKSVISAGSTNLAKLQAQAQVQAQPTGSSTATRTSMATASALANYLESKANQISASLPTKVPSLDFLWNLYRSQVYASRTFLFMDPGNMISEEYEIVLKFGGQAYIWEDIKQMSLAQFTQIMNSVTHVIFAQPLKKVLAKVFREEIDEEQTTAPTQVRRFLLKPSPTCHFLNIRFLHLAYAHIGLNDETKTQEMFNLGEDYHRYHWDLSFSNRYIRGLSDLKVDVNLHVPQEVVEFECESSDFHQVDVDGQCEMKDDENHYHDHDHNYNNGDADNTRGNSSDSDSSNNNNYNGDDDDNNDYLRSLEIIADETPDGIDLDDGGDPEDYDYDKENISPAPPAPPFSSSSHPYPLPVSPILPSIGEEVIRTARFTSQFALASLSSPSPSPSPSPPSSTAMSKSNPIQIRYLDSASKKDSKSIFQAIGSAINDKQRQIDTHQLLDLYHSLISKDPRCIYHPSPKLQMDPSLSFIF